MKIAVVGPGAVGSYYGAKLCRDGHEVHFLLRSDYEQVRRHGVRILSPEGDFNVRPKCARTSSEIGPCDLVLISIKSTANEALKQILPPLVSEETAVLTLQNGLGKLVLVNRKARTGRNPATGETIKIPAKKVVKFRVAKACKDAVLNSK